MHHHQECMHIDWSDLHRTTLVKQSDFLVFFVCGVKYETLRATLERFPDTLLGRDSDRQSYYVNAKDAYFLNRCRKSFEAVLYFYQSGGVLVRPSGVSLHVFLDEVRFYKLGPKVLKELHKEEGFVVVGGGETKQSDPCAVIDKCASTTSCGGEQTYQQKIWELFESPDSSSAARIVSFVSMFVIGISIIIFCLETLPVFRTRPRKETDQIPQANSTNCAAHLADSLTAAKYAQLCFSDMELCCVAWFTLEYLLRLFTSPSKTKFLRSPLNMIDFFAILPYFIGLWINADGNATPLSVLRVVRLVRVFRIFKLSRHSMSLQILGNTLRASVRELVMLIFFLSMGVLVFSSAIFYADLAESGPKRRFHSIPDCFWYTLVTMTTVGYGDVVPSTRIGKIIGSTCALTGVLTLAVPVPVIVSNFEFFYKRDGRNGSANKEKEFRDNWRQLKKAANVQYVTTV